MALTKREFLLTLPLAAVACPALFGLARSRPASAQDGLAGRVSRLAGTAIVVRQGAETPLAVEQAINIADTIRTAADSRAEVTFTDGSVLTVGPNSDVAVSFFAPEANESAAILDLVSGIARMTVNKATAWGRFEVRTTTAVASVRGTDYLVEALPEKSSVFVAEGRVAVSSRVGAGTVVLREGQGVDVTGEYVDLVAKFWGEKRRVEALARVTIP
ncbi:MAG: FecR domain-containing protein [Rhodospirillaceae bacterium]|nr:FecR domain-containing protein [Rhodospirillaceae bacterium]